MLRKLKLTGLLFVAAFSHVLAQHSGTVSGKLKETDGQPLEFASVGLLILPDSSLVKGTLTDSAGHFRFEQVPFGNYLLRIELMGYVSLKTSSFTLDKNHSQHDMGTLSTDQDHVSLETVTITSKTPLVEQQVDKTVLNVENSILSEGNTAIEVLQRAPGVTVDQEGNIALKGKKGVTIMLNGKLTYLSQKELAALLRGTPSSSISKVEVIANPSAKYDAAGNGGIINIVLKKNVKLGYNGSAHLNAGASRKVRHGSGLSLNYRSGKLNLFGSYDFAYRGEKEYLGSTRIFSDSNQSRTSTQSIVTDEPLVTHSFRAGSDFYLNDKNTLGFVLNGNAGSYQNKSISDNRVTDGMGNLITFAKSYPKDEETWKSLMYNLNYKHIFPQEGREWSADFDYSRNSFIAKQLLETHYSNETGAPTYVSIRKGHLPSHSNVYVGKMDYTHPFSAHTKLEAGWKSSWVNVDNEVLYDTLAGSAWLRDNRASNQFLYEEQIHAGYLNFHQQLGKLNIQAGLRGENTHTEGNQVTSDSIVTRDYFQLFPSIFLNRELGSHHKLQASYSRRIERPDYGDLNPWRFYRDPYFYYTGNPYLYPELTNSFELSHAFKGKIITTLSYTRTYRSITWIMQADQTPNTSYETPVNLQHFSNYGASINVSLEWGIWSGNQFANVFYNEFKGEGLENSVINYSFNSQNTFQLGKGFSAELNGQYGSRSIYGIYTIQPQYKVSGGLQKKILKDKGTLKVAVNDIFQTYKRRMTSHYENIQTSAYNHFDSRMVMFSFTYRFGNSLLGKSGDKEEDELKRAKGGR